MPILSSLLTFSLSCYTTPFWDRARGIWDIMGVWDGKAKAQAQAQAEWTMYFNYLVFIVVVGITLTGSGCESGNTEGDATGLLAHPM